MFLGLFLNEARNKVLVSKGLSEASVCRSLRETIRHQGAASGDAVALGHRVSSARSARASIIAWSRPAHCNSLQACAAEILDRRNDFRRDKAPLVLGFAPCTTLTKSTKGRHFQASRWGAGLASPSPPAWKIKQQTHGKCDDGAGRTKRRRTHRGGRTPIVGGERKGGQEGVVRRKSDADCGCGLETTPQGKANPLAVAPGVRV